MPRTKYQSTGSTYEDPLNSGDELDIRRFKPVPPPSGTAPIDTVNQVLPHLEDGAAITPPDDYDDSYLDPTGTAAAYGINIGSGAPPAVAPPYAPGPHEQAAANYAQQMEGMGAVRPAGWRTALALAAQFGLRRNPGAGQAISSAIIGSDPQIKQQEQLQEGYKLESQLAQQERLRQQSQALAGIRQQNATRLSQNAQSMADTRTAAEKTRESEAADRNLHNQVEEQINWVRQGYSPAPTYNFPATAAGTDLPQVNLPGQMPQRPQPPVPIPGPLSGSIVPPDAQTLTDPRTNRVMVQKDQTISPEIAEAIGNPKLAGMTLKEATLAQKASGKGYDKQAFQGTVAKVATAGGIPPGSLTDVNKLSAAIKASGVLGPDEKSSALAYLAANSTPAAQGSNTTLRVEGMAAGREYPVINKQTGQMEMRSAAEINASKGNYAPAGAGAQAMSKEAVFQDLHYNIDSARKAISALDEMDTGTRAALSYALRSTDPRSAVSTFLTGAAGQAMTPEQQEAVQSLALLNENAMTLRGVSGMGQGSDELRDAIRQTLPSGKSPNKGYALKQLDKFESVVNRLETGVPRVRTQNPPAPGPAPTQAQPAGGPVVVNIPGKGPHTFKDQATADAFKKAAGIQ